MAADRTGSQAGFLPLFLIGKTQRLVLVSPKWILKGNLLALSPCVEQGEEGTAALGALSLPAVLPLCYLLALDILVIPYTLATPM